LRLSYLPASLRLILALLAALIASFAVGVVLVKLGDFLPCEGEGLACNIDEAVGAYAVLVVAALGPLIYAITLFVATNRTALLGATLVLLTPLVAGYLLAESESWRYVGFYPYSALRTFLVFFLPPCLTLLVQWFVLRLAFQRGILG
jgi:nitrate/nitrite transporter NarK